VKALEIAIGIALLSNRFVPLAIVAAWPITLMIAFVTASHGRPFGIGVAVVIISLNAIMSLGHLDRYRPMLVFDAGSGGRPGRGGVAFPARFRLTPLAHALAAMGGLLAAIAITYLSLAL